MDADIRYARLYDTSRMRTGLRARSVSGGAALMASQAALLVLGILRGGVMARFLSAADYGIQGMVLAFLSLTLIFKDLGLSTAIVREKRITHAQVSNLFWINAALGLLSAAITIAAGPVLGWFYSEPRLVAVCAVISVSYLLGSLCVQPQALLQRQMRFGTLAAVNVGANVASSVVGIGMAWQGCGYWALIGMQIAASLFQLVGAFACTAWGPSRYDRSCSTAGLLRFGGHVTGLNVFGTLCKHVDAILIGRLCGAASLGLYSRGLQPVSMLEGQLRMALSGVALPALSSLQGAPDRFVSYYLKFLSILAFLSMPVAAWCFLFADAIIHFYLGPGWYEVTPYFRLFALASFFSPAMLSLDRVPLACGHARQYLYTGVLGGTVKVAGITVGVIGWGPMGAAVSIVVSNLAIWGPYYLIAAKGSPLRAGEYARTLMAPTAVSLAAGSLAWGAVQACGGNRLTVLLVGSAVFWASCVAFYAAVDVSGFWCRNGLVRRAWAWVSARSRTGNGKQP